MPAPTPLALPSRRLRTFGSLRQPITIERATTTDDGLGGQTVTWNTLKTWWAEVRINSGTEEDQRLGRLATTYTVQLVGRFDPDITSEDRCIYNGIPLNIRFVQDPDGYRHLSIVTCEAGVTT